MTAVNNRTDGLEIGIKYSSRLVVGVTDIVPGNRLLLAEFTHPGHGRSPSLPK